MKNDVTNWKSRFLSLSLRCGRHVTNAAAQDTWSKVMQRDFQQSFLNLGWFNQQIPFCLCLVHLPLLSMRIWWDGMELNLKQIWGHCTEIHTCYSWEGKEEEGCWDTLDIVEPLYHPWSKTSWLHFTGGKNKHQYFNQLRI